MAWSLAVEEQFYLIFPFIVKLFSKKTLLILMCSCVVAAPLLRTILVLSGWGFEQVYPLLPCRVDSLALGVIAAFIVRSEDAKAWVRENSKSLYWCLAALLALQLTMLKWVAFGYRGTVGYSILGLSYFLLVVLLLVAPVGLMTSLFRTSWLRWLGTVSYCVYLIHQAVRVGLSLLFGLGPDPSITGINAVLVTIGALAATLAIAQASWIFLEKGLIKRAHLRYRY